MPQHRTEREATIRNALGRTALGGAAAGLSFEGALDDVLGCKAVQRKAVPRQGRRGPDIAHPAAHRREALQPASA